MPKTVTKAFYQTLQFKLLAITTASILLSVIGLTVFFIQRQKVQLKTQLLNRGETVAGLISYNARYGVQISDKDILDKIIGGVQGDPDVVYTLISDKQGKVIASFNPEKADQEKIKHFLTRKEPGNLEYTNQQGEALLNIAIPVVLATGGGAAESKSSSSLEDDLFDESPAPAATTAPAKEGEKRTIGMVQVGISFANMKKDISASIRQTVFFSGLIFVLVSILSFWLGSLIAAPIRKVVSVLNDISQGEGDLSQRIQIKSNDETGDLAAGFNTFMDKFQEIKKISVFLNDLADGGGDLTKRLGIVSSDEIGMLAKGFDRFTDKLHEVISQVAGNSEKIAQASQSVSDNMAKFSREINEVAKQASEVASSSGQISRTIENTSENVSNVNQLMNHTESVSAGGVEIVHETRTGMSQIAETVKQSSEVVAKLYQSSQKIGETISTITEIADQTKLIAINAAIEASRVGAQGKGFAVVAEEIRRLAARVTKATTEISQSIMTIQKESLAVVQSMQQGTQEANRGVQLSQQSEESLAKVSGAVQEAKGKMNQIAISSNEQTVSIGIISRNINNISDSAKESSTGITETARSMQELNKEVQALRQLVGQFVLDR